MRRGLITIYDNKRGDYNFWIKSSKKLTKEEIDRATAMCASELKLIQDLEDQYLETELKKASKEFEKKATKGFLGLGKRIKVGDRYLSRRQYFKLKKEEVHKKFSNPESTFKSGR